MLCLTAVWGNYFLMYFPKSTNRSLIEVLSETPLSKEIVISALFILAVFWAILVLNLIVITHNHCIGTCLIITRVSAFIAVTCSVILSTLTISYSSLTCNVLPSSIILRVSCRDCSVSKRKTLISSVIATSYYQDSFLFLRERSLG